MEIEFQVAWAGRNLGAVIDLSWHVSGNPVSALKVRFGSKNEPARAGGEHLSWSVRHRRGDAR
jgi:hypothetical protein